VWDASTGQQLWPLEGSVDIAYSPDGRWLATAAGDTAKLWDAATGAEVATLRGHDLGVWSVAFSADSRWLATGSADGTARVWDLATGETLYVLPGGGGEVTSAAFRPAAEAAHLVLLTGGSVREYVLALEDLLNLAQTRVTRGLTEVECQRFLHLAQCPAP
jgi:WD40 repeat protein